MPSVHRGGRLMSAPSSLKISFASGSGSSLRLNTNASFLGKVRFSTGVRCSFGSSFRFADWRIFGCTGGSWSSSRRTSKNLAGPLRSTRSAFLCVSFRLRLVSRLAERKPLSCGRPLTSSLSSLCSNSDALATPSSSKCVLGGGPRSGESLASCDRSVRMFSGLCFP